MARIYIVFDTDRTFAEDYKDTPNEFTFKKRKFVLAASFVKERQHKICMKGDANDLVNYGYIREVLSSLSWQERISVREVTSGAHGQEDTPCLVGEGTCGPLTPGRAITFMRVGRLFEPITKKQGIGLALYRRALNAQWANFPLYAYLSFFKILELAAPSVGESAMKQFMQGKVDYGILDHKNQYSEITERPGLGVRNITSIVEMFYNHRQDCAHALRSTKLFNPDIYCWYRGMMLCIPLLEIMAEHAMVHDLKISL